MWVMVVNEVVIHPNKSHLIARKNNTSLQTNMTWNPQLTKQLSTASVFQCFNWSVIEVTNHMSQNKYEHAHYSSHFTVLYTTKYINGRQ